jgi:succinyl-CoA synthetase beta subunit
MSLFSPKARICGRMPFQCARGLCLSGFKHQSRRDGIMNIHEYQAKALLRDYGAPVSDGRAVLKAEEAKTAAGELDGPLWVVKAQIHAGGRGKGHFKEADAGEKGGVRLAKSVEEAEAEAKKMLGRTLVTHQTGTGRQGRQPHLYRRRLGHRAGAVPRAAGGPPVEPHLLRLLDRGRHGHRGGRGLDPGKDPVLQPSIPPPATRPFHGRRIAFALGLEGKQVKECVNLMGILYKAFVEKDMEMLEINPLIVTDTGR